MDSFTEGMLNRLDKDVKKKFGVSLCDIMDNPSSYIAEKGFVVKLSRINDYVEKETDNMLQQAKASSKTFHENASKADELTRKIGSYVSSHARQNNIPLIKPVEVELPRFGKSTFYISELTTQPPSSWKGWWSHRLSLPT